MKRLPKFVVSVHVPTHSNSQCILVAVVEENEEWFIYDKETALKITLQIMDRYEIWRNAYKQMLYTTLNTISSRRMYTHGSSDLSPDHDCSPEETVYHNSFSTEKEFPASSAQDVIDAVDETLDSLNKIVAYLRLFKSTSKLEGLYNDRDN